MSNWDDEPPRTRIVVSKTDTVTSRSKVTVFTISTTALLNFSFSPKIASVSRVSTAVSANPLRQSSSVPLDRSFHFLGAQLRGISSSCGHAFSMYAPYPCQNASLTLLRYSSATFSSAGSASKDAKNISKELSRDDKFSAALSALLLRAQMLLLRQRGCKTQRTRRDDCCSDHRARSSLELPTLPKRRTSARGPHHLPTLPYSTRCNKLLVYSNQQRYYSFRCSFARTKRSKQSDLLRLLFLCAKLKNKNVIQIKISHLNEKARGINK